MNTHPFNAGAEFDFGIVIFSEEDIIEFARRCDPLDFHTDPEAASKHMFKGLVCSGQQPFNYFYVHHWIPAFGKNVLCGLSVQNWRFIRPVYAHQELRGMVRILQVNRDKTRASAQVLWQFSFYLKNNELAQELDMLVLHRLDS